MPAPLSNFYAKWRAENEARLFLRDAGAPDPSERLLQAVWHHQRLLRDQLRTLDGKTVRVLHPGFWNREAGPDFHDAIVQIGQEPPLSGDIEVDLSSSCWHSHNHDVNPGYKNVILHVIWSADDRASNPIPALALDTVLDSPLKELKSWFNSDAAQGWPEELLGECCSPLRHLSAEDAQDLLHQAAEIRFHSKALAFEARARQCGWDQALWEGLFRALGYKQNVWPMQRLAELLPRGSATEASVLFLQARLFGLGGLLPDGVAKDSVNVDPYVRSLWDHWWREQEKFTDQILPKSIWRFNGLRPANQPQRRLALAAHWTAAGDLFSRLERWFTTSQPELSLTESLLECLQGPEDDFWSRHWSFKSAHLPKPQPLLGTSRLNDIAVNVVLPWFWMRASAGKNEELQKVARDRYFEWPAAQDNAILRQARQRLFGRGVLRWLNTAAAQQGLLQIVRDCCNHSNAICAECPFPELVRCWEVSLKGK